MRVVVFSAKPHDRDFLPLACADRHELVFHESRLSAATVPLAAGAEVFFYEKGALDLHQGIAAVLRY